MARRENTSGTPYGTLELLILAALRVKPLHGYAIARQIEQLSGERILVEEGSLYPALQRLLKRGSVTASWETQPNGREVRQYTITAQGRKTHAEEVARWEEIARGIQCVIRDEEGRLRARLA
ncbi:MAG: PadR family transcriptional regulator [Phycisphaerales bacterium]